MDLSHPWTTWPHICNELPFTSREFVGVGDNGDPLPLGGGGGGRTVENEREKKMETRIWLRVVYKEGEERGRGKRTEIRCCVKYNTYFTTEIPIPSTRSEIHCGAIRLNELPSGNFLLPERSFPDRYIHFKCKNSFSRLLYNINIYILSHTINVYI